MFTGIIQKTSPVLAAASRGKHRAVRIKTPSGWKLKQGASISVDGICTTIVSPSVHSFEVLYMPETLSKTTAGFFKKGSTVNLERPLSFGDPVDGHFVQGHVDARGKVIAARNGKRGRTLTISIPRRLMRFVIPQGSISINGASLTVAETGANTCSVALIPHTLRNSNLGLLAKDDFVNIEIDMLARYRKAKKRATVGRNAKKRAPKKR